MPDVGITAKDASGIPAMLKELPTELTLCYVLVTFLVGSDDFLFFVSRSNVLNYRWSLGTNVTFGGAILFLTAYAFFMRVICPLLQIPMTWIMIALDAAVDWLSERWRRAESQLFPNNDVEATAGRILPWTKYDSRLQYGFVFEQDLRELALDQKDAFLLDIVSAQEQQWNEHIGQWDALAHLAFPTLMLTCVNVFVGRAHESTISWVVWKTFDAYPSVRLFLVGVPFACFTFGVLWWWYKLDRSEMRYIKYPPLAREKLREREQQRQEDRRQQQEHEARLERIKHGVADWPD